jgi:RimJ/RimL family protein N-acetyltransferase
MTDGRAMIVPIRVGDMILIMRWRNEQMHHLRQSRALTMDDQSRYFLEVLGPSFADPMPDQLLFSYLVDGECVGYGGLVHISWEHRRAELSFLLATQIVGSTFAAEWAAYLSLIERVAFNNLNLHKIFTYAYDIRPDLYPILESAGFLQEARLRRHITVGDEFVDVLVHGKVAS